MTLFCSCHTFYNIYFYRAPPTSSVVENVWEAFHYIGIVLASPDTEQTPDCHDISTSVVWEGVSVGQSPGCWDDCWNAEQTQTPQLTGRGWALIWECQNLLLSHRSRGEADCLFINEISWQCVCVWHISEHILSNEDDKILEFSPT